MIEREGILYKSFSRILFENTALRLFLMDFKILSIYNDLEHRAEKGSRRIQDNSQDI